jgi:hypothetical protein
MNGYSRVRDELTDVCMGRCCAANSVTAIKWTEAIIDHIMHVTKVARYFDDVLLGRACMAYM